MWTYAKRVGVVLRASIVAVSLVSVAGSVSYLAFNIGEYVTLKTAIERNEYVRFLQFQNYGDE